MKFLWPIFASVGLLFKGFEKVFLSWWLSPWLQAKENQTLWNDIQINIYFLSEGRRVDYKQTRVLPFNYATVAIDLDNVRVTITRGRGELNISISPRSSLNESFELNSVILALYPNDPTGDLKIHDLTEAAGQLRAHWEKINRAFSDEEYPKLKALLQTSSKSYRVVTNQTEWEFVRARNR